MAGWAFGHRFEFQAQQGMENTRRAMFAKQVATFSALKNDCSRIPVSVI